MILVDTSVWVDHLRRVELELVRLLDDGDVCIHPYIVGEIACGNLGNRYEILRLLENLPIAKIADHKEVMSLIEQRALMERGVGYVDVHLVASSLLSECRIWTRDKRLGTLAKELGISL